MTLRLIRAQVLVGGSGYFMQQNMGRIHTPALIVWGDSDQILHPSAAKVLHEGIADSKLVMLPGRGHVLGMECPAKIASLVLGHVAAHSS